MKHVTAALACALVFLCLAAPATAGLKVGVADDAGKYADDGGAWFYTQLADAGMSENRISVFWDASHPAEITESRFLDRAVATAEARGIAVSFAVSIGKARSITAARPRALQFAAFLQELARAYPYVREFIVGNEPNQNMFWQPQFNRDGTGASGVAYERLLAVSYDALKAVDPAIVVWGVGLSPRGNDRPHAPNNVSTSPVRFLRDMGAAYRGSARRRPIMDGLAFHPYPNPNNADDPPSRGYQWPNAGVPNLDRIKQAFWDAFNGTGQPTFAESDAAGGARRALAAPFRFKLDEAGWQAAMVPGSAAAYHGKEVTKTVDEATQARYYADLVRRYSCDPSVQALLFFHLVDEDDLDRFQSGLVRADRTLRPSFGAVRDAIAASADGCLGRPVAWRHARGVVGARVSFQGRRVRVQTQEDATYTVAVLNGGGRVTKVNGMAKAYWDVRPVLRPLRAGRYSLQVTLRSAINPSRVSTFTSGQFAAR
jgi:hypothetical protein